MDLTIPIDVDEFIVSPQRPARTDGSLDVARCIALHNYLVQYGWQSDGRALQDLQPQNYFEHHGDEADQVRDRLDTSLIAFLEAAAIPSEPLPLYFWVSGLCEPSDVFVAQEMMPEDEEDRFLTLYATNDGMGEHPAGLIYDQRRHRAAMSLGIEDFEYTHPVEEHEELWHPLETVLSQWISLIQLGKITASQDEAPNEKYGPWIWQPYSMAQVDDAVASFHRLVAAIEQRMPIDSPIDAQTSRLLFSEADLDAALVPKDCFARHFLARLASPRFRAIAPGLIIPHDAAAFEASQKFTKMDATSEYGLVVPPVLLFAAADGATVNFDSLNRYVSLNPFCKAFRDGVSHGDHSIPAGLYSESVERFKIDNAEEGFRLLLPFSLREHGEESGARKSDGTLMEEGSIAELFQHGYKPFGGEWWRAQRLSRLFDLWTSLINDGTWTVGPEGVEGTIDLFRDAAYGSTRNYMIAPSW
ncbi:hypothetical protein PFICI_11229 [Pestalotiopsis fici W106-1]|uniref:Uncharacterized protein n=1 Tax=Pestalotiopsis fici (strain W106-1 / CGMCC3.15140) TaxID=1229662 RepID=W3WU25_PESFW|nr:uncharacterized protein PFICI_11229 [Pestalotiopsis fici W106-1]ETS77355.1 hypothetical protein PFICI_11229 [Pestalotiopsis fici W106-1]